VVSVLRVRWSQCFRSVFSGFLLALSLSLGLVFSAPAAAAIADAGPDQYVIAGEEATLDGSASLGPRYQWRQKSGQFPLVSIRSSDERVAYITAPSVSSHQVLDFSITVADERDGRRGPGARALSATDWMQVHVYPPGNVPQVDAGEDQKALAGSSVSLAGSVSGGNGTLRYQWTQQSGTPTVRLSAATQASASFAAPSVDVEEVFVFQLQGVDRTGQAAQDTVSVTVSSGILHASAGQDQDVASGVSVTLNAVVRGGWGERSHAWTHTEGTPTVTLSGEATAQASFTAPEVSQETVLAFGLTVSDDTGSQSDELLVSVYPEVTVSGLALVSRPQVSETYQQGEEVKAQLRLTDVVIVDGAPQLQLQVGSAVRSMTYVGLERTALLEFSYTVQASDTDADGVSIGAEAVVLQSPARITGRGGATVDLGLAAQAITDAAGHRVAGASAVTAPAQPKSCPED